MLHAFLAGKGTEAEVARELRFADGAAAPQERGDHAVGAGAAALARESACGKEDMSLSDASDRRPLSDATRKARSGYSDTVVQLCALWSSMVL